MDEGKRTRWRQKKIVGVGEPHHFQVSWIMESVDEGMHTERRWMDREGGVGPQRDCMKK